MHRVFFGSLLYAKRKWTDLMFIACVWSAILLGCVLKNRASLLWMDELIPLNLIGDPSPGHMLRALSQGVDGGGPLFYLLAWVWARAFSFDSLSLRLFSAASFCGGIGLLWAVLRRKYDFWPAALGLVVAVGSSQLIAFEIADFRFYGLIFLLLSLALWLAVKMDEAARPMPALLFGNALTHGALVLSNPLGGLFSAVVLASVLASDLLAAPRRIRLTPWLSYPAGWSALGLWWRGYLGQSDITKPHTWVPMPNVQDLLSALGGLATSPVLFLFPVLWLLRVCRAKEAAGFTVPSACETKPPGERRLHLCMAVALISVVPMFWLFSRLLPAQSIFFPRYFMIATLGWAIALTQLAESALGSLGAKPDRLTGAIMSAFIILGLAPLIVAKKFATAYFNGAYDEAFGHPELPIVCLHSNDFLGRRRYAAQPSRYYILLDWHTATDPASDAGATVEYKLMRALKRNYPGYEHIQDVDEFLRAHHAFLVIDRPDRYWTSLRLTPPDFTVTRLVPKGPTMHGDGYWPLLLVERNTDPNRVQPVSSED